MEHNPFSNLATFIEDLNISTGTITERLEALASDDESFWDVLLRGLQHYNQVMHILESLGRHEDIIHYMEPSREFLFSPGKNWHQHAPSEINTLVIHGLRNLGRDVDIIGFLPHPLDAKNLEALQVTFTKIRDVVSKDSLVPKQLASYILYLCQRGLDILNGAEVDLVALRSLTFEVTSLGFAAAEQASEETKTSLHEQLPNLVKAWVWDFSIHTASSLTTAVASKAIEGGASL